MKKMLLLLVACSAIASAHIKGIPEETPKPVYYWGLSSTMADPEPVLWKSNMPLYDADGVQYETSGITGLVFTSSPNVNNVALSGFWIPKPSLKSRIARFLRKLK